MPPARRCKVIVHHPFDAVALFVLRTAAAFDSADGLVSSSTIRPVRPCSIYFRNRAVAPSDGHRLDHREPERLRTGRAAQMTDPAPDRFPGGSLNAARLSPAVLLQPTEPAAAGQRSQRRGRAHTDAGSSPATATARCGALLPRRCTHSPSGDLHVSGSRSVQVHHPPAAPTAFCNSYSRRSRWMKRMRRHWHWTSATSSSCRSRA